MQPQRPQKNPLQKPPQHKNRKIYDMTQSDISRNITNCVESLKNCCNVITQKLHRLSYSIKTNPSLARNVNFLRSNHNKKFKYSKVRFNDTVYYSDDVPEIKIQYPNIISSNENNEKLPENFDGDYLFDGMTNVWIVENSIQMWPKLKDHREAINILKKPKQGNYIIITKSKIINDIDLKYCKTMSGEKLHKQKNIQKNTLVYVKLPKWRYYIIGSIHDIHITTNKYSMYTKKVEYFLHHVRKVK